MNNRQIELFAAVMKAGSVSRAAELLGVTQPGVSRAIAELERSLGFRLFDRVRNRIVPTPEGRLFHAEVEASFRGMDRLRASAARIRDHGAGQIRIGSLSALGSSLVPRAVRRFREMRPDIAVTLMVLPSRDVRDGVVSGAFDLGLAADEIDVSGVLHQPFVSPRALCAMPIGHPLCERETITPHDLAGVDFIAYVPEDRARQRLDQILAESGAAPPHVVVETIYASTVCSLVAEGVGVGLVSPYAVAGADPSRLVLRPFEPAVQSKSLLILPLDRPKSQLVRDFIDCLMAAR
ncbi:MAG TPA: LysR substrate-binding domain-containing protein [Bosea sp. (in: a-proteobacteria)]|jgi:DNA-binding transcriptional LysR family regulator|uniref:LysR substrate-binding domain-containing protein n=1 Tax=Bosea sp. (in: a-proteobacteria) TaxID=1871050 RepID=UPI002E0F564B|nr:LysR substrate-binding domain-containing protein [Bosea sp. (in: a-proteobacteria)]